MVSHKIDIRNFHQIFEFAIHEASQKFELFIKSFPDECKFFEVCEMKNLTFHEKNCLSHEEP